MHQPFLLLGKRLSSCSRPFACRLQLPRGTPLGSSYPASMAYVIYSRQGAQCHPQLKSPKSPGREALNVYVVQTLQLACKAGDRVMVASASRKASVWPGKTANLGEVFHPATIARLEPGSVHVKYLPPAEVCCDPISSTLHLRLHPGLRHRQQNKNGPEGGAISGHRSCASSPALCT